MAIPYRNPSEWVRFQLTGRLPALPADYELDAIRGDWAARLYRLDEARLGAYLAWRHGLPPVYADGKPIRWTARQVRHLLFVAHEPRW